MLQLIGPSSSSPVTRNISDQENLEVIKLLDENRVPESELIWNGTALLNVARKKVTYSSEHNVRQMCAGIIVPSDII